MNLYDDESLKQEVIYLHSLWHQGPPRLTRNPIPNFSPIQDPIPRFRQPNYIPPANLQLLSRYGAVSSPIIPRNPNPNQNLYSHKRSRPDSGREWPVKEPSPIGSGWPEFSPCKKQRPISAEEKARFAINKLQRDIHRTCREFFGGKSAGEEETTGEDGSDSDGDEEKSEKEFHFLTGLFELNKELKDYYEKKNGNGEFWCLVCGGTGDKSVRKFKSCLALVQHSLAINKTDLMKTHRAQAKVVCNVLAWDVNNPVASSQKTVGVEAVLESASETASELKNLPEKQKVMSVNEQAKKAILEMQQNASGPLKDIFGLVDATEEEEEKEDDGDLTEKIELVSKVFAENVELKSYYEKKCEGGSFVCMVCCAATDKKMIKRFKHCYGLVQHCTKMPKIKKQAHKAFAKFVCDLLGWEFDSLPRRVIKGGDALQAESNANQNNETPSSVVAAEEHMCEDKDCV